MKMLAQVCRASWKPIGVASTWRHALRGRRDGHLRLDDGFAAEPTIAALTDGEFRLWLRVLCHCARYKQPAVTTATRREVRGLGPHRIERFVSLGLLQEAERGSYKINDWTKFQPRSDGSGTQGSVESARGDAL